jgi:hypothetical protein
MPSCTDPPAHGLGLTTTGQSSFPRSLMLETCVGDNALPWTESEVTSLPPSHSPHLPCSSARSLPWKDCIRILKGSHPCLPSRYGWNLPATE